MRNSYNSFFSSSGILLQGLYFNFNNSRYAVPDYVLSVHSSIVTDELNTLIKELLKGEEELPMKLSRRTISFFRNEFESLNLPCYIMFSNMSMCFYN